MNRGEREDKDNKKQIIKKQQIKYENCRKKGRKINEKKKMKKKPK